MKGTLTACSIHVYNAGGIHRFLLCTEYFLLYKCIQGAGYKLIPNTTYEYFLQSRASPSVYHQLITILIMENNVKTKILEEFGGKGSLTESIHYKSVCRTASATPGLLIIQLSIVHTLQQKIVQ